MIFNLETNPQFIVRSKVIGLHHFVPVVLNNSDSVSSQIAAYLSHLLDSQIEEQGLSPGCCFLIPSLSTLSEFFNVSIEEIRYAFRKLKIMGHDHIIPGYYGNISIWAYTTETKAQSEKPSGQGKPIWNVAFVKSRIPCC